MVATDLLAFVRANLPAPPVRLLEIGAGDGTLEAAAANGGARQLSLTSRLDGLQQERGVWLAYRRHLSPPAVRWDTVNPSAC